MLAVLSLASCPDDAASYGEYLSSLASYGTETLTYGNRIGLQSEGCSLPVTPSGNTFQIWGNIYAHQAVLSAPGQMDERELHHLARTFEESRSWLRSFASGDREADNREASRAIDAMRCHMERASHLACEDVPRSFACCAYTQHFTWLRIASALSDTIVDAYGSTCGTRRISDDEIERLFARRVGRIVASLPAPGVHAVARRTALAVVAWALRGSCDRERDRCVVLTNVSLADRNALDALRDQSDSAAMASLACTVEGTL